MLAGRDDEIELILTHLRPAERELRGVLITGDDGIGKTSLWRAAVDRLRPTVHRALVARPLIGEPPGVGLRDLFDEVDDPYGGAAAINDLESEPLVRGRAVLSTLRDLTGGGTVLIAIDDVQWLDDVTARALRYALRRLRDAPVTVVATLGAGTPETSHPLVPPEHSLRVELSGLDERSVRELVRRSVDAAPRPVLDQIHTMSAGNPMYAIELARIAADHPGTGLPGDAATRSLTGGLSRRLREAPPSTLAVVQATAALGASDPDQLARTVGGGDVGGPLADAVARGLVGVDDTAAVRCAHPLLGEVALSQMDPADRRALHLRIAGLVDPESRARHLALAHTEPDDAVASELEVAAARAGRRGTPAVAAELCAHSRRLTPPDDRAAFARRMIAEVLHRAAAGEPRRAISTVDTILALLPQGRQRAAALALRIALDFRDGPALIESALSEAGGDEQMRGRILDLAAFHALLFRGRVDDARRDAATALDIAIRLGDPELEMLATATLSTASLLAGRPDPTLIDRALALSGHGTGLGRWPEVEQGRQWLWNGQLAAARRLFEELDQRTVRSGIEFQRPFRMLDLALVAIAEGQLERAAELAADGLEAAADAANQPAHAWVRYAAGLANAHLGRSPDAIAAAHALQSWGTRYDEPPRRLMGHHVAGIVALANGEYSAALRELERGLALAELGGRRHPAPVPLAPDAVEAAAGARRADRCAELTASLATAAGTFDAPWVDAVALRSRGLAAVARGDADAAALLAEATTAFDTLGYALDAARACHWRGVALARAGRRTAAADALVDARGRFRSMAAHPWERRAADELSRIAPELVASGLTTDERELVELVRTGHRNREIADSLNVSPATVEARLTRLYRKLGVRSRTELIGAELPDGERPRE